MQLRFDRQLRAAQAWASLKDADMAQAAGVTLSMWRRWTSPEDHQRDLARQPLVRELLLISEAAGVPADFIFQGFDRVSWG